MKWSIQERGGVLYSAMEPHIEAVGKRVRGRELYFPQRMFIALDRDHIYWVYGIPEHEKTTRLWIKRWLGDTKKRFIKTAHARYAKFLHELVPWMDAALPDSPRQIGDLSQRIRAIAVEHTRTVGSSVDGFDDFFQNAFSEYIAKQGFAHLIIDHKSWAILTVPAYRSAAMECRHELVRLFLEKKPSREIIDYCHKKYIWLSLGWGKFDPATRRNITNDLRGVQKEARAKLVKEELSLRNYVKQIKAERSGVVKKYRIPLQAVKPYLELLDDCAALHDQRKEIQMRTLYISNRIQKKVAAMYGFNAAQTEALSWMTEPEFLRVIRTGVFPKKSLKNRMRAVCFDIEKGTMKRREGARAVKRIEKMLSEAREKSNLMEVTGTRACLGVARGRVFVAASAREAIHGIRKGDVLITTMTTPDFIPAMKKAVAIVTDQGGITSHAALISREMGIPCIIGTKSATQLFKTGDMVEVDADRGIVRPVK